MVEVIGENHPDMMSEETEVGLKAIATVDKSYGIGNATIVGASGSSEVGAGGSSENGNHSVKSEDSGSSSCDDEILDILKFNEEPTTNFDGNTYEENETSVMEAGESSGIAGEVMEEEMVEFEFKKANPTQATYSMHCPNCKAEVVLRREVITLRPPEPPAEPQPSHEVITSEAHGASGPLDLDRYISSARFFTGLSSSDSEISDILKIDGEPTTNVDGNTYKKNVGVGENSEVAGEVVEEETVEFEFKKVKAKLATYSMHCPNCKAEVTIALLRRKVITSEPPVEPVEPQAPVITSGPPDLDEYISSLRLFTADHPGYEARMDVRMGEFTAIGERRYILVDILKSIVYGSLMEVIVSLSVVAFAVASDASTLNIIALALASLIGGIVVIWHNVWELRNDCYKNTDEQTEGAINKYKEIFGRINCFRLHAFCAILSSLILGMIPPVVYGFSFYKTNDKDFTMLAVAIMSLLCVGLLAIFKAFFNRCGASKYFKTTVYYLISAVLASSISYVAGNLVTRLLKELGLFDTRSGGGGGMSLVPHDTTSYLASF